jgi:hypothetical protein
MPAMDVMQNNIVLGWGIAALAAAVLGTYESAVRKNPFHETPYLLPMGIFVWGDAGVIGLFWFVSSVLSWILTDWWLFLLLASLFWIVRSLGEVIYWLNQQFSTLNRNPPERMRGYRWIGNDSIWFVYQIAWQCVMVFALAASIYCAYRWISLLP